MKKLSTYVSSLLLGSLLVFTITSSAQQAQFVKGERPQQDLLRDKQSKGPQIVDLAEIKEGMKVLDIFGGGGYYSEILSAKVGDSGQVYLHNNQAYMPWIEKELVARLKDNRLENVVRYDREADDLGLQKSQFDAVFYVLGYHDLYHKADGWDVDKTSFLNQVLPAIKSKGKLAIIDHSAVDGSKTQHSQELHRIDKQYVIDEVSNFGFKLVSNSQLLANPEDTRMISPFKPEMRRKTDRFILIFEKL